MSSLGCTIEFCIHGFSCQSNSPVFAGAKSPPLDSLPGGKKSLALSTLYARSTPSLRSVSIVAMPSALTTNDGPIVRILHGVGVS